MKRFKIIFISVLVISMSSCMSIEETAMKSAANMLSSETGGASVFTKDNDPELIADALPLALKLYEMVLASNPEHAELHYSTGKNFVMYANAFIQTPAGMLPDEEYKKQEEMVIRAKKMYIRGRDYIIDGIELNHPGFTEAVENGQLDEALKMTNESKDAGMLYWAASGWIGAYSCDPFDFELANTLYIPSAMLLRALELDENFNKGAIHDIFIQIYSSLPYSHIIKAEENAPETVGLFSKTYYKNNVPSGTLGDKVNYHFKKALEIANGTNPGTYCSYAGSVCVKEQNYKEYKELLEKALAINPEDDPANELVTTIFQDKARWMLEHAEDFFIVTEE
ncbi:MAG: TRAP transporter TatT component family protein [Spirochaetales bacterium]|nr:TRAP transporter TatT component family protein [Spirochaetales bacterium]